MNLSFLSKILLPNTLATRFFVVALIFGWIFSGWPQFFNFPPRPSVTEAAQVRIELNLFGAIDEFSPSPNIVYIDDQTGYAFYVDTTFDNVAYSKTTDGGVSWGDDVDMLPTTAAAGSMGADRNWAAVAVWYDQWTPGDTTGTKIHIAAVDALDDEVTYSYLDSNGDVRMDPTTLITGTTGTAFTPAGDGTPFITKATDGDLFAGACGTFSSTLQCVMHTSTDDGANWGSDIGDTTWNDDDDSIQLLPLSGGDILGIFQDDTADTISSKVYDQSTGWDGSALLNATLTDSTTYDISWGASLNVGTGNVYLAASNAIALDSTTNDIDFYKYTESSRTWTTKTDVATNNEYYQPNVAIDANTDDLYVFYPLGNSNSDTADDTDVFYTSSSDDGATWGTPIQLSDSVDLFIWYVRTNMYSDSRLVPTWYSNGTNDLVSISGLIDLWGWEQSSYRFFNNLDGTDVGSALATQNTPATLAAAGDAFRLRALLHNTGQAPLNGETLKLQFATKSGSCDTGFSGETYADVTGATAIAYNDNASPSDGDNLTSNANDPTHSGHTIVNQDYEEANNFTNTVALIADNQDGKWDFSLIDNGAPASTSYCFRVVKSDGSELEEYTVIPEITTASSASQTILFSISDVTLGFGTLSSASSAYATGDTLGSASETVAHTIAASTNATDGYTIIIEGPTLTSGSDTITEIGGTSVAPTSNSEQFGLRVTASGGVGSVSAPYNHASNYAYDGVSSPDEIASASSGDDVTTTYSLRYVGNITSLTEAGSYSALLTYTMTANY